MVDPAVCPIPPGFEYIKKFSNNFYHFKETTGYNDGGWGEYNHGFSNRWKNSDIRSANIVCGFQFKIGPDPGWRWTHNVHSNTINFLGQVKSGDVSLFFPRQHSLHNDADIFVRDRGNYIVQLKWYIEPHDGPIVEASLKKEYPHGSYGGDYFQSEPHFFHSQPNPRPHLEQIRDGQWHSFLGVIYNDYHRRENHLTSGLFPIIGLWFSPVPTHNFNDFIFLGMGIDKDNMDPSPTLTYGVEDSNEYIGDHILAEHPLQIRIDDVPTNQVEIRNMYAANVRYTGIRPSEYFAICTAEARAIIDAQAEVVSLEKEAVNLSTEMKEGGPRYPALKSKYDNIQERKLPNAKSDLRAAEFIYGRCKEREMREVPSIPADDIVTGGVFSPLPKDGNVGTGGSWHTQ
jgi:hypothetical protein